MVTQQARNMQYENYAFVIVLLNFLFLMPGSSAGSWWFGYSFSDIPLISNNGTVVSTASTGAYLAFVVINVLTYICAFMAFYTILVNLVRLSADKVPGTVVPNVFTCFTALFNSISSFIATYIAFTVHPATEGIDENLVRTTTILGMSLIAILFWFALPLYALGILSSETLKLKVEKGMVIIGR